MNLVVVYSNFPNMSTLFVHFYFSFKFFMIILCIFTDCFFSSLCYDKNNINVFINASFYLNVFIMIVGATGKKAVHACMIKLFTFALSNRKRREK